MLHRIQPPYKYKGQGDKQSTQSIEYTSSAETPVLITSLTQVKCTVISQQSVNSQRVGM